ncbi:MAG: phosphoribosylglycinamide formyltransferase [Polyangiaceae bacterium]
MTLRLGVLVSGAGTNLQAILDAVNVGRLDARVQIVISNRPDAGALSRAVNANVPNLVIDHRGFESREHFDAALVDALRESGVDLVVLAGFMRVVGARVLRAFPDRVINLHPALLPAFPGTKAIEKALEHGVKVTGCTVHFVDEGVDSGPIIAQRAISVREDDDAVTLRQRLAELEHELLVHTLQLFSAQAIAIDADGCGRRRVRVKAA